MTADQRPLRRLSFVAVAGAVLIWAIGIAFGGINGIWIAAGDVPFAIGFTLFFAVGVILVLRVSGNTVSWVMLGVGTLAALMVGAEDVSKVAAAGGFDGVAQATATFRDLTLFALIPLIAAILPLLFPTGSPPSARWRWVGVSALVGYLGIASSFGVLIAMEGHRGSLDLTFDPGSPGRVIQFSALGLWLASIAGGVASLGVRWFRARGVERAQLQWLVPAFTILAVGLLAEFGGFQNSFVAGAFSAVGLILVPISIGFAITRYRLYDIGRIVSRTVTYATLAVLIAAVYALGAVWLPTRLGMDSPILVAATTLGIAVAFNPVRRWLTTRLDRRFNRTPYDPQAVADGLSAALRDRTDAGAISAAWAGVVNEALEPAAISVWTTE